MAKFNPDAPHGLIRGTFFAAFQQDGKFFDEAGNEVFDPADTPAEPPADTPAEPPAKTGKTLGKAPSPSVQAAE